MVTKAQPLSPSLNAADSQRVPPWSGLPVKLCITACLSHGHKRRPNKARTRLLPISSEAPDMPSEHGFPHVCRGAFKNFLPLAKSDWQLATGVGDSSSLARPGNRFCPCSTQHRTAQPVVPSRPAKVTSTLIAQRLHKLFFISDQNKKMAKASERTLSIFKGIPTKLITRLKRGSGFSKVLNLAREKRHYKSTSTFFLSKQRKVLKEKGG